MNKTAFINEISRIRPSSTFLSLKGYTNSAGEVADYNIIFNMSYENALIKSLNIVREYQPSSPIEIEAKSKLIESFKKSLASMEQTPVEDIEDGYTRFFEGDKHIKGVKLHDKTNTIHLFGLVVNKKILSQGSYSKTNKRDLTLAQDKIKKLTPLSKFRQFKITPDQVQMIS